MHGLAGDFVRLVGPETESDMMALLVPFLAGVGNIVGRHCAYVVEATPHFPGLYVVVVGASSKGRKGTSRKQMMNVLRRVDPEWDRACCTSGLTSGEGLIHAVRDPLEAMVPESRKPNASQVMKVVDPGVIDKRCLVYEAEFAQALRVLQREGNTLSPVIRSAWDGEPLRILSKNSPEKATDPHISILAHTTKEEILRYLDRTELCNGFGNRFLWVCAERSKLLPFGGHVAEDRLEALAEQVRAAVAVAQGRGHLAFDAAAHALWARTYPRLSAGHPGLFGSATARAEAQVARIAQVYAILDSASAIGLVHLRAGLAVWAYCEASARFIFGEATGDPTADRILKAMRESPDGLNRTQIQDLFGRNRKAEQIQSALNTLAASEHAAMVKIPTAGRDLEVWLATKEVNYTNEVVGLEGPGRRQLEGGATKETKKPKESEPAPEPTSSISSFSSPSLSADAGAYVVEEPF